MIIKEVNCKSILNKSKLSADYCINPYTGCSHKCFYCYARFMKRFTNHQEDWGDFVDVKINAVDALKNDLRKIKSGSIFFGSVTDCYQPIEAKYQLTRKILEALPKNFEIYIQTKSALVQRDIDLIKKFRDAEVGFTITFSDDNDRKNFEPFASPVEERIQALREIKKAGIETTAFLGPMLPFISDKNIEQLFEKIKYANHIYADKLNIKSGNWEYIIKIIREKYPGLEKEYNHIFFDKGDYYDTLKQKIKQIRKNVKFCY